MTDPERKATGDFVDDPAPHNGMGRPARSPCHDAFRATFDEHRGTVRRILYRLGARPSEIDDLTQEVFLILHRRRDEYDPTRRLLPWLYGIAARVVAAQRRRARRSAALRVDGTMIVVEDAAPLPDRWAELRQDHALMIQALDAIDEERCALLLMHDLDGTSVPEIASALGVSVNTVYSRLRLARADFHAAVSRLSRRRK